MTTWIGIKAGKRKLDVALLAGGKLKTKALAHDGHELLGWLGRQGVTLAQARACVATAGIETERIGLLLHDEGCPVSMVDAAPVLAFARDEKLRVKNDAIDAPTLARYGAARQPDAWTPPPKEVRVLAVLQDGLRDMETFRQDQLDRLERYQADGFQELVDRVNEHIPILDDAIAKLQTSLANHLAEHPHLKPAAD